MRETDEDWSPELLRALAAVGAHVSAGEVLAARVFSARHLGNSKALEPLRARLERLVGPLDALGIRKGATVTLIGGAGVLTLPDSELDLARLQPFIGLSLDVVQRIQEIRFPKEGLMVVENLAPLEACSRREVVGCDDTAVVWSGGYPGQAVRALVGMAARDGVRVRAWADLDLDGVRIARLIASWAGERFEPFRMSPADVSNAPVALPLPQRAANAIRSELAQGTEKAILSDTLRAILDRNAWIEQESFLGSASSPGESP